MIRGNRSSGGGKPCSFHRFYLGFAGRHPHLRLWHHQWLAGSPLYAVLRPRLALVEGNVLDVGCGSKPYRAWVPGAQRYVGIDVVDGPEVDAVIEPGRRWPVEDDEFDVVLCTQVIEHVADLELTVDELARSLRPGGEAIVTVPFIFGEHNSPHDYRRLSRHGAADLFANRLEVIEICPHGAIGSTLGSILLGWTFDELPESGPGRLAVAPVLPLWALFCLVINLMGALVDRIDRTGLYYGNVLIHARKPQA